MPATYNGIGTTYYGKKNLRAYEGQCEFCRRTGQVQEYETVHWFVVLYIPVIPLGRKQILDFCTVCKRHRVLPLAEWERVKEESISAGTTSLANNPDDPESATALLRTLSGFGKFEEAEKLAQGIQQRFDDDANVQFQIGQWHEFRKRSADADACYRAALALDPQHVAAKRGVACGLIETGQLDAAIALLRSPPQITPPQDPALFVALGRAHQQLGQHEGALDAFADVLDAVPKLRQDKSMRKLVRASEKQLPPRDSILPGIPLYSRMPVLIAVAVVLLLAAIGGVNYYLATHQTLHLVNGFAQAVEVQVDGGGPVTVLPHSRQGVPISEGHHASTVSVDGRPLFTSEFDVDATLAGRFFDRPVFVLNAGGGAVIASEQITYRVVPREDGTQHLEGGRPYHAFADVDYHFVDFPPTINLPNGEPIVKSRVGTLAIEPAQVFYLGTDLSPEEQFNFAEAHLKVSPYDDRLLQEYLKAAIAGGQIERARDFIAAGLDAAPVRIEWHRSIASLSESEEDQQKLRERYAKILANEPSNSAVLYLAGRLEPRTADGLALFDRAIESDPDNAYPWFAKGYHFVMRGDFAAAKAALEKAVALKPADETFRERLQDARFALGEYAALEQEARKAAVAAPLDIGAHGDLIDALLAQGKRAEAEHATDVYLEKVNSTDGAGENAGIASSIARMKMHYLTKDYDGMLAEAQRPEFGGMAASLRFVAHLERGQYAEAAKELGDPQSAPDAMDALLVSIAWHLQGDNQQADEWQARACSYFDESGKDNQAIAGLLRQPKDATDEAIDDMDADPRIKACVLVALALQLPERRAALLDMAEKLNYARVFPYNFLQGAIAAARRAN